jgi:hypothetical protein
MSVDSHGDFYNPGMDPHDGLGNSAGLSNSKVEMQMYEEEF